MSNSIDRYYKEGLHEECGVFGVLSDGSLHPAYACYNGLLALQHRGQESCGIAVSDEGVIDYHKNMGLVSEVFSNDILDSLDGQMGISLIARARLHCHKVEEAVAEAMRRIQGAYSLLVMSPRKIIAARDPHGFRPLCIGKFNNSVVVASESAALDACGAKFIRDVEPGEIIVIDGEGGEGYHSLRPDFPEKKKSICIFEYIYFARSDSLIDGVSVYEARKQAGRILARTCPVEADMVIGVPESGIDAAIGYAEESGIPYEKAIVKNAYIGRTFIKPSQKERMKSVRIKLNPIGDMVKGKRVIMIDDSIVRGTTVDRIVTMLRDAGAKEVHMRISSPPFMWPCYYGTDIPSRGELIAVNHTIDEITKLSGADSLAYLPVESLHEMIGYAPTGFCQGCFTGEYPAETTKLTLEGKERGGMEFSGRDASPCVSKDEN